MTTQALLYTDALARRERRGRLAVRIWLWLVAALVLAMIVVGGATRLTDSGLSITEWKPVTGAIPPLSAADWTAEFDKYRQTPEFQRVNKGMTLSEFRVIYWWEWGHRFLGRIVGVVFLLPLAFFWWRGRLDDRLKPGLVLLGVLGGAQGAIGWWMVSSGLVDRVDVSQYRLATHLGLAFLILALIVWLSRGLARPLSPETARLPKLTGWLLVVLLAAQILMGAIVAGLDAGLAFNDWPTMDGQWWPDSLAILEPGWRNLFENPKTAQFTHRLGGYAVLLAAILHWVATRTGREPRTRSGGVFILGIAGVQVALGIATLVSGAPLTLSLAHQLTAALMVTALVATLRDMHGRLGVRLDAAPLR